jgi:hypothetical protein
LGGEYAVVPSWTYNNASARDITKTRENDVVKATVVSLDRYEYEASQRKDTPNFNRAGSSTKSFGLLVKGVDNNGKDQYWTTRLADVLAEWSVLEPRWNAQKKAEQDAQRQREEAQRKEQELRQRVEEEVARSRNSVEATARELLGDSTSVSVATNGYGQEYKAWVSISLREFEQLIEMAYAGKENY